MSSMNEVAAGQRMPLEPPEALLPALPCPALPCPALTPLQVPGNVVEAEEYSPVECGPGAWSAPVVVCALCVQEGRRA